ncbi:MAG: hypothetical protein U1F77_07465 [Kiritimatiellia bacterium]
MKTLKLIYYIALACALGACATTSSRVRVANAAAEENNAALAQSIRRHDMASVTELLSGKNINTELYYRQLTVDLPPLFLAAQTDNHDLVEYLLKKGANPSFTRSTAKDNVLHFTTSPKIMDLLIGHGANMNSLDYWGRTPLVSAIKAGWTSEIVGFFIERSPDLNTLNHETQTALNIIRAEKQRLDSIERMLVSRGAKTASEIKNQK